MWQYGGCIPGPYCNTGWHSSPVVADLNGDGQQDVIWGSYDVVALNGADGSLKWRAPSGNRVWPGIAVADLTGNGTLEVIVGRDSDQLTVYDRFGGVVWTRNPFGGGDELRSLAVADLDKDGQLEIITGQAAGVASRQLNVLEANGTVRPGWPARHDGEPGDSFGMWNQNVVVADMNSDGFKELFVPGGHYINAFDRNGNQLTVNPIFAPRQFWSEVGTHVDQAVDLRGYANCGVEHRPSFQDSAPVVADVDGDGVPELIVVGNVYNCGTTPYTSLYHMPFIFKLDRTRWSGSGFDWTVIPTPGPGSAPRSEDYNVIENVVPNAVVADLDGDGFKEILFPSYDGKVHAYWLDKTEHGSWPYTVPTSGAPGDDFRFASEPVTWTTTATPRSSSPRGPRRPRVASGNSTSSTISGGSCIEWTCRRLPSVRAGTAALARRPSPTSTPTPTSSWSWARARVGSSPTSFRIRRTRAFFGERVEAITGARGSQAP